ncbi:MAG: multiheme c-type cytochrome [Luteolibacter sp.]
MLHETMGQARKRHEVKADETRSGGMGVWIVVGMAMVAVVAGIWWLLPRKPEPAAPAAVVDAKLKPGPVILPDDKVHAGYAGSASCKDCHQAAYEKWMQSNHHFAERMPDPKMDGPAFEPAHTIPHGRQSSEAKLDEKGLMQLITQGLDKSQPKQSFTVRRVIGHDPLRQFMIEGPGGRMQAAELAWDPHKSQWFDVYGNEDRQPGEWGHWTGRGMNWNAQCANCHNTRLRRIRTGRRTAITPAWRR